MEEAASHNELEQRQLKDSIIEHEKKDDKHCK